jgi:putative DNA primase/helicase
VPVKRIVDPTQIQENVVTNPRHLAEVFLNDFRCAGNLITLRLWKERWWRWHGSHYVEWSTSDVKDELRSCIQREFDQFGLGDRSFLAHVTTGKVENTLQHLRTLVKVPNHFQQPAWLDETTYSSAEEYLACQNGLIHVPTYLNGGTGYRLEPTPSFFSPNVLDFAFDAEAPDPAQWLKFLESIWADDQENIDLLQEWFGYCLISDTRHHKAMMLIGPPRAGKGVICRTLAALVGDRNAASTDFDSMAGPFGLQSLVGKTVAVLPDERISSKADVTRLAARLLKITGGDEVEVNAKYAAPMKMRLPIKFMVATNQYPDLGDPTTVDRFLYLRFTKSFVDREDKTLEIRLQKERSGILLWALAGLKRLQEQGKFTKPASGESVKENMRDINASVAQFVGDCCQTVEEWKELHADESVDPENYSIPFRKLYAEYRRYCSLNGISDVKTDRKFRQDFLQTLPHVASITMRWDDGDPAKCYCGVVLRPKQ